VRAFGALLRANLKMTLRNRMGLFWLLLFPALFIVLFGYLIGGEQDFTAGVGVVDGRKTDLGEQVTAALEETGIFSLRPGGREESLEQLREGDLSAVVLFPRAHTPGETFRIEAYVDETQPGTSQAVSAALRQTVDEFNRQVSGQPGPQPVALSTEGMQSEELRFIDFLVPGILGMSIMNSGIIGLSTAFVVMRERGILRRIRATPLSLPSFIGARVVTQLVVALAQVAILLGMAKLLFDLRMVGSLLSVAVFVVLGSLAFLSLGFFLAGISGKVESANALANLVAFPMLFLSGVFFRLDVAPQWVQYVAHALPLTYLAEGLRQVMVYGTPLPELWPEILALLVTIGLGLALASRFFREPASG
jgi:ABC-2 type transport system permease protein